MRKDILLEAKMGLKKKVAAGHWDLLLEEIHSSRFG